MSPASHSAPSRNAFGSLLGPATALFTGRSRGAGSLRGLDSHTLADIGIAQVGQGPAALQLATTDTGGLRVNRLPGKPPVE